MFTYQPQFRRAALRLATAALAAAAAAGVFAAGASADLGPSGNQLWQQGTGGLNGSAESSERGATGTDIGVWRKRGDGFGKATATGDFNGDGVDDLAIGAPDEDAPWLNVGENTPYDELPPGNGAVTIIYGSIRQHGLAFAYEDQFFYPANDGVAETGDQSEGYQEFGYALAAGDFNHDFKDDLAIGVPGNRAGVVGGGVVVLYGQSPGDLRVGLGTQGARYLSQDSDGVEGDSEATDRFGAALAVGDFDLDFYDDLAVGVPFEDDEEGAVNVIHGGATGLSAANGDQMWDQDTYGIEGGAEGCSCHAGIEGDRFGWSLAAGDFDGNHHDDLAIGIPYEAIDVASVGAVAVIYSRRFGLTSLGNQYWDQNSAGIEGGAEGGDLFGWSLAAGRFMTFYSTPVDSLAIGVPGETVDSDGDVGKEAGAVNVIHGSPALGLAATPVGDQMWDQNSTGIEGGVQSYDGFGTSLAAGKFRGSDALDGLAIGVPNEDETAGAVAVLYPTSDPRAVLRHLEAGGNQLWQQGSGLLGAPESDGFGYALATGDFDRNGSDDLAAGAPYEDLHKGAVSVIYAERPDTTPPEITPHVSGPRGRDGWYVGDVTVSFTITDPETRADPVHGSCATKTITYDGAVTVPCTARSEGGTVTESVTIRRDATAPTITAERTPQANPAGWNNTDVRVEFGCTDATSGVESCTGPQTVSEEGASQSRTGTAVDRAGNVAEATVGDINIDKTAPRITAGRTPEPNAAGWNNKDVDVEFQCEDQLSGVGHCTPRQVVRTEGAEQFVYGTVIDRAGNTAELTVGSIKLDKTAPAIEHRVTPEPNAAGWHNSDVDVEFTCADGLSKIASCSPGETLSKDGKGQSVLGEAVDRAGNVAEYQVGGINIDKTAPTITGTPTPQPNKFGWNNTDVTVAFHCKDATSGVAGKKCPLPVELTEEGAGQVARGTITDAAGNAAEAKVEVNIDKTAPTIGGGRTPAPNAHGWNNTDVTVGFGCKDALSGVAGCQRDVVVRDEGARQAVPGTVIDRAGNTASTQVGDINIDKTAPAIAATRTPEPNAAGWNNTEVTVSFECADRLAGILTCSQPLVVGDEGAGQSAEGAAVDRAGNRASTRIGDINIDRSGPQLSCAVEPTVLWAPNHQLVPVDVTVELTDPHSGATGFVLASATSSEPDDGTGDGSTTDDIVDFELGTPDVHGSLRAERSGTGIGRAYTLTYRGTDGAGNAATCDAVVQVAHDQG